MRAYAIQKAMAGIDLGVELGAKIYVFWGGREGVESDAPKSLLDGVKRYRGLGYERLDQLTFELLLGAR